MVVLVFVVLFSIVVNDKLVSYIPEKVDLNVITRTEHTTTNRTDKGTRWDEDADALVNGQCNCEFAIPVILLICACIDEMGPLCRRGRQSRTEMLKDKRESLPPII